MLAEGWQLKAALRRLRQPTLRWQGQPALAWPSLLHKGRRYGTRPPLLHKGRRYGTRPPLLPAVSSSQRWLLQRTSKCLLLQRTSECLLVPRRLPLGHAWLRHTMLLTGRVTILCLMHLRTLMPRKAVALLGLEAVLVDPSRRLLACGRMSPACTRTQVRVTCMSVKWGYFSLQPPAQRGMCSGLCCVLAQA